MPDPLPGVDDTVVNITAYQTPHSFHVQSREGTVIKHKDFFVTTKI